MFDEYDVQELCDMLAKAYYNFDIEHAKTIHMELADRLEFTSVWRLVRIYD